MRGTVRRVKEGKSRISVFEGSLDDGRDERVATMLLYGWYDLLACVVSHSAGVFFLLCCRGVHDGTYQRTSNRAPPLPITLFRPRTKSPALLCSSSIRLVQSGFPEHTTTCWAYDAIVFSRGVL